MRWAKMRSRRVMKAEKEVRNVNWGGGGFGEEQRRRSGSKKGEKEERKR